MREQLGLGLGGLRKMRRQRLGNALVVLLPGAFEEGLIRGFLDQRVFKQIGRLGRVAAWIEQFRVHELPERPLQGRPHPRAPQPAATP